MIQQRSPEMATQDKIEKYHGYQYYTVSIHDEMACNSLLHVHVQANEAQ